jgi:PKD domain
VLWFGVRRVKFLLAGIVWLALLGGAQAAAAADDVTYQGGPVAHSMTGVIVDWGPNINPMYTNETSGDPGFIKYLAAESGSTAGIGGVLAQYMDSSGHNAANQVSYGQQYEITPSVTSTTILDSQIRAELAAQIQSGHLPHPAGDGLQTLYLVLFPAGDTECIDAQDCSANAPNQATADLCAYHGGAQLADGTNLLYAVIPDDTTGPMSDECGNAQNVFDDQTSYLSHEWSETISDPLGNAWWVNNPSSSSNGNEIGDNCDALMGSNGGWAVQLEWSNLDDNCVASESAYQTPTASFVAPGVGSPGQPVSVDASSSSDPAADAAAISGTSYSIGSGIASYEWNWGDGSSSLTTTPTTTHSYAALGDYQVSLTVTDNLGFTSTVTHALAISSDETLPPSPTAPPPVSQPPPAATQPASPATQPASPAPASAPPVGAPSPPTTPPAASTGPATRITPGAAIVSGTVAPNGTSTSYHVEFGTTRAYGHSTPSFSAGAGTSTVPITLTLTGLAPRTLYHYRLVATSAGGTSVGADSVFRTGQALRPAPRFSFRVASPAALRAALRGRLKVHFRCSRACAAHFAVTASATRTTRFAPVAVTLARAVGRIGAPGDGTATLTFTPAFRSRLRGTAALRLIVVGYAVSRGSSQTAPRAQRLTLT